MKNFDTRNKTKIQNTIPYIRDDSAVCDIFSISFHNWWLNRGLTVHVKWKSASAPKY